MIKRLQNRVAESRFTLPATILYGAGIWLLCGLIQQQWWVQLACFIVSTYLMIELNNGNALIRIYSRSVSAAFIIFSCMACFMFPSMEGAIAQVCMIACLLTIFQTYQDKQAIGWSFYTFVFLSLASLVNVRVLWFIPFYWILMIFFVFSLGHRSFVASLLGLMLPYWFMAAWTLWRYGDDFTPFLDHFKPLADFQFPIDYSVVPLPVILTVGFMTAIYATGVIHYIRTSYNDKIRIRQIFYSFIFLYFIAMLFLIVQPQHYDLMLRMMIIAVSPLIAHFISLTYTRITNIAFFVIVGAALILTVFNIWSSSFIF